MKIDSCRRLQLVDAFSCLLKATSFYICCQPLRLLSVPATGLKDHCRSSHPLSVSAAVGLLDGHQPLHSFLLQRLPSTSAPAIGLHNCHWPLPFDLRTYVMLHCIMFYRYIYFRYITFFHLVPTKDMKMSKIKLPQCRDYLTICVYGIIIKTESMQTSTHE